MLTWNLRLNTPYSFLLLILCSFSQLNSIPHHRESHLLDKKRPARSPVHFLQGTSMQAIPEAAMIVGIFLLGLAGVVFAYKYNSKMKEARNEPILEIFSEEVTRNRIVRGNSFTGSHFGDNTPPSSQRRRDP